ncbi:peptidase S8/S53 domain-containing protein [Syncephalis fuscata]|nr:peptidase S8/S53 domain-containing protein [Syncephalis fuscata]
MTFQLLYRLLLRSFLLLVLLETWAGQLDVHAHATRNDASHLVVLKGKPEAQTLRAISNHTSLPPGEISMQTVAKLPQVISVGNLHVVLSQLSDDVTSAVSNIAGVKYVNPNHQVRAFGTIEHNYASRNAHDKHERRAIAPIPSDEPDANNGTGVIIYVLDTGIDIYHTDLGNRATWGFNAMDDGVDRDESGHGTFVAGLLGGNHVLDKSGEGSVESVLRGLEYVHNNVMEEPNRLAVVNLSLGTPQDALLNEAVAEMTRAGIVVVNNNNDDDGGGGSGNGDDHGHAVDACDYSPGNAPESITVGATDIVAQIAPFSNYGTCVDLLAPGNHVHSIANTSNTTLVSRSGTSFAAPVVAGAAACAMASFGTVTSTEDIRQHLLDIAVKDIVKGNLHGTPNIFLQSRAQFVLDSSMSNGYRNYFIPIYMMPINLSIVCLLFSTLLFIIY